MIDDALGKHPDDLELQYYKAQAYSIKANITAYTLFPVMKMKLFDVAMNEWSIMDKIQSRQNLVFGLFSNDDLGELTRKRKSIGEMKVEEINYTLKSVAKNAYFSHYTTYLTTRGNYIYCGLNFTYGSEILIDGQTYTDYPEYNYITLDNDVSEEPNGEVLLQLCGPTFQQLQQTRLANEYLAYRLRNDILAYATRLIDHKISSTRKKNEAMAMAKAGMALFDSLPILRQIPTLDKHNVDYIYDSLQMLDNVRNKAGIDDRLGRNARQQTGLLAAYLLIASIKNSVELDKVLGPMDFLCQANPHVVVDHYPYILTGAKYLLDVLRDTELEAKNSKTLDLFKKVIKDLPEKLDSVKEQQVVDEIKWYIQQHC